MICGTDKAHYMRQFQRAPATVRAHCDSQCRKNAWMHLIFKFATFVASFMLCAMSANARAEALLDSTIPSVYLSADMTIESLINLYHAVAGQHDTEDIIVVRPPDMRDVYGDPDDNDPAGCADAKAFLSGNGELIYVRLVDASYDRFGAEYMLASQDQAAIQSAHQVLEQIFQQQNDDAQIDLLLESAAEYGRQHESFRLMNIDPAE